jgi:glyoxylase-like metal-dependent hydrolase (beta-lactamase superfamily II)
VIRDPYFFPEPSDGTESAGSMKRLTILTTLLTVGLLSIGIARAQQDLTAIRIEKVKDRLYIITGGRGRGAQAGTISGNTTVFVADSGVVLVDSKLPGFGQAILDQVRSVTSKPVTIVINTHTHGDHTGGNPELPRAVEFVAHENTRRNMERMNEFRDENSAFLPKTTFKDRMSLLDGRDRIDLYYFGAGHTSGDAVVVFTELRTVVMGDLFARKWAPLIDANNGGSALAFPQTVAKAVSGIRNVDAVITGHSTTTTGSGQGATFVRSNPVMRWADLEEYSAFLRDFVEAAQAARKAGKTVDEAVNTLKLSEKYKGYNLAQARADVQRVYDESKP